MARRNNGKRPIEMIDLTDDNASLEPQQSRNKIPRPLNGQAFSQSQRDTWVDQADEVEEEDDADHVIILSQDGDSGASATTMESFELYGKER